MKKWTALLAVLVLLWTVAGAGAEAVAAPDLYDLYEETAEGTSSLRTLVLSTSSDWLVPVHRQVWLWPTGRFRVG